MNAENQPCSCCSPKEGPGRFAKVACPRCGSVSDTQVGAATLQALLVGPEKGFIYRDSYQLCLSQSCPVVYFDPETKAVFTKDKLSVRVGYKELAAPRPLCYCFGHAMESLREEWLTTGQSTVAHSIREAMRTEGCRCETTNPKGTCCLGDVIEALREVQSKTTEPQQT